MADSIRISVDLAATIRVTNGVEVRLTATEVQLSKLGPRGGEGVSIVIPIAEWDKVNAGVQSLKNAIEAVDSAVKAVTEAPTPIRPTAIPSPEALSRPT